MSMRVAATVALSDPDCMTLEDSDAPLRGNLTQAASVASVNRQQNANAQETANEIPLLKGNKTLYAKGLRSNVSACRVCVQNAISLKISETCNPKTPDIHRVFHRFCGKVLVFANRELSIVNF